MPECSGLRPASASTGLWPHCGGFGMVGTGPARVVMNGHKATWEGAGPRTSVSPTSCLFGAPEISPATRFTFDKWRPGHAGPGPGGGGGHHTHRYLSIHHTHRCSTFVKDTFSFSLPFNPGQSISSQHLVYNNAPTLTIVLPSREMAQGCFSQDARNGAGHCVDER